jgi:hypothetical protein
MTFPILFPTLFFKAKIENIELQHSAAHLSKSFVSGLVKLQLYQKVSKPASGLGQALSPAKLPRTGSNVQSEPDNFHLQDCKNSVIDS